MKSKRLVDVALIGAAVVAAVLLFRAKTSSERGDAGNRATTGQASPSSNVPALRTAAGTAVVKPVANDALGDFQKWAEEFAAAGPVKRPALMEQGRALAGARRTAMAELIRKDPRQAIENALPYRLRTALPAEIADVIEHPVRGVGDYSVLGVAVAGDTAVEEPYRRVTKVNGRYYSTYVYGARESQITTANMRVLGVGLDDAAQGGLLALREQTFEVLSKEEAADIKHDLEASGAADAICSVSGEKSTSQNDEQAVSTGAEVHWFCRGGHIEQWAASGAVINAGLGGSGSSGGISTVVPPTHAQGNKRFLLIRFRFANQAPGFEPVSDAVLRQQAQQSINDFAAWSYGKLHGEFVFTPTLTSSKTEAEYAAMAVPEDPMMDEMLALAAQVVEGGSKPYVSTNFDFLTLVFDSAEVGTRYCGLAGVGGNRSWIRCVRSPVLSHEWGHNFALWHANQWEPTGDSPIGEGIHREYGGRYSTMQAGFPFNKPSAPAFNTAERWTIGWLGTNEVPVLATNGVYRLYNADVTNLVPGRAYGYRAAKDHRWYTLEFRPNFRADGGHDFHADNGVILTWHYNNQQFSAGNLLGTHGLDMHPLTLGEQIPGTADSPLLIGRTFTDPVAGLSVTPLAKGGTFPGDYIDIDVRIDRMPTNSPPAAGLAYSAALVATNQPITFTASGFDPDGDSLSYWWDFGDGRYSADGLETQVRSWAAAGDYTVRLVVSDRRGGTASRQVVVRVGNPSTYVLSGQVLTTDGAPLVDAIVDDGLNHVTYTDANGAYSLGGFRSGSSITLRAQKAGWSIAARFGQPMTVQQAGSGLDFTATALRPRGIALERWENLPGITLADLTNSPRYLEIATTRTLISDSSQAPAGFGDNYGQRIRAWFYPPVTGPYAFYISSDDASQLSIGTDEQLSSLRSVASVSTWTPSLDWARFPSQRSASVQLEAGRRYALQVLHKEGFGGDHVSIGVDLPDGTSQKPILPDLLEPMPFAPPASALPVVSVVAGDASATEGGDTGSFTISRTGSTAAAMQVVFNVSGTATPGSDYTSIGFSVAIPAGSASVVVPVTALTDSELESSETVILGLTGGTTYTVAAPGSATVTLQDGSTPQVSIVATDSLAAETGGDNGIFTISRLGNNSAPLTVNYVVGGTAEAGSDYRALPGLAVIPAGSDSVTVTVAPLADSQVEGPETVEVTLTSGSYAFGLFTSANVLITTESGGGQGVLREWFDGLAGGTLLDLIGSPAFPDDPTGRQIVTGAFESGSGRGNRFGERWRALFTAPSAGDYRFYIYADDVAELWMSPEASGLSSEKVAYTETATGYRDWTSQPYQESAPVRLERGQKCYLEVRWAEGEGADYMGVGVKHPNGLMELPIPGGRLDPFTPLTTPLASPWTAIDIGAVNFSGRAGIGRAPLSAPPLHRYSLDGIAGAAAPSGTVVADSIGRKDAVIRGSGARFSTDGKGVSLSGGDSSFAAYVDLPNGVASGNATGTKYVGATYEAWLTLRSYSDLPGSVFSFGSDFLGEVTGPGDAVVADTGFMLTPSSFDPAIGDQFIIHQDWERLPETALATASPALPVGTPVHLVTVYDPVVRRWIYYRDGVLQASFADPLSPGELTDVNNWLGRSSFGDFPNTDGIFHEFRIYNYALSAAQVRGNTVAGPDQLGITSDASFSILGSGAISTNDVADSLHFEARPVTGALDFRAKIASLVGTNGGSLAGLMIRSAAGAGSPHAFIGLSPDGFARFISRTNSGESAVTVAQSGVTAPSWIRLVRGGGAVSGYLSADGTNWTLLGTARGLLQSDSVGTELPVFAGLAASSPATNSAAYAMFDRVSLSRSPAVSTYGASSVATRSATLRASVTPNGDETAVFFEYGTNSAFSLKSPTNSIGRGQIAVSVETAVAGLLPHTAYRFRAVATGVLGFVAGVTEEFTTLNSTPVASNDAPAVLTHSGVSTFNVLANDGDADGDTLRVTAVSQGAHGTVAIVAGGTRVSYDPVDSYSGTDSFTYTIDDGFGGTATGIVAVQVPDTAAPTIGGTFAPLALTTGSSGSVLLPNYLIQALISDNVGVASSAQSPAAGSPVPAGTVTVELLARDSAGNLRSRTFDVVVADGTLPVITACPPSRTLASGVIALPDLTGELSASDNVAVTSKTQVPTAGTTLAAGTHTVTLTARDAAGNSAVCTVQVTATEAVAPAITYVRANVLLNTDAACQALMPDVTGVNYIVATGESGPFTFTQSITNGTVLVLGTSYTNVTTVTGAGGTVAYGTNRITLRDLVAPVITAVPPGQTVDVAPGAQAAVPDFTTGFTATDCNGPMTLLQSPPVGTLLDAGTHSIFLSVSDASGNRTATNVNFVVNEVVPPAPRIAVSGNSVVITDGDLTPDPADFTEFGPTGVGGGVVARTFTIQNTGDAAMNVTNITVSGAFASEFTVADPGLPAVLPAGSNTTFTVTFDPAGGGLRVATVNIASDGSPDGLFEFAIRGVGLDPAAVTTVAASGAVGTNATLNGSVNALGETTTVTFEYGTSTAYGGTVSAIPGTVSGNALTPVSASVTGLTPGQEYHFRIVAVNANGTSTGDDLTFTPAAATPNQPPTVAVNAVAIAAGEGQTAQNSGTFADADGDAVSLTASVGTVTAGSGGAWTWSYAPADGPDNPATVTITATDTHGDQGQATFALTVNNTAPVLAGADSVTVSEGLTAANSGTWSDAGTDTVTLSASLGTVVKNSNGTWSWSYATTDGPDNSASVTITATDSDGADAVFTFALTVKNIAPALANSGNRTVSEGATASNSGTWSDVGADTVTLSASIGTVVQNGDGTWTWSVDTTGVSSQQVTITGTDSDGLAGVTAFNLTVESPAGATFVWNAASNGANWSTTSSWTITAGTDADGIPDGNDDVIFNNTRTTTSTVGASFAIRSLQVTSGYTGVISLGNNTLSIANGLSVAGTTSLYSPGGTVRFTASQTVSSASALWNVVVDAGAVVSLPSNLTLWGGALTGSGVVSNAGGKLVVGKNDNQFYTLNFGGTVDDVVLDTGDNGDLTFSQNLNINDTLLISHVRNMSGAGAIKVNGTVTSDDTAVFNNSPVSLVGATDQILTGPGMLLNLNIAKTGGDVLLPTNFIVAYNGSLTGNGRIRNTGGKLVVGKNDNQFYTLNFAGTVDDVVLDTGDNGDLTFSQNLNINNTLLISHVRNMNGAGSIRVNGTVTVDDPAVFNNSPVSLVGGVDQTLTGPGTLLNLTVAKSGGDVLLPTDFSLGYNGSLAGMGRIRNTGGKLVIGKNDQQFYTLNFGGTVDDVVLNPGDNGDLTFSQHLNVNNTLLISHVRNMSGAGAIKVNGTVTSDDTTVFNNSPVSLVGATDQILTGLGMLLNLNIAKTGGDVLLPTNFVIAYNGSLTGTGRIRNTGGKLVVGKNDNQFYTLNFGGTVDDVVLDTGDNGDLTFSQHLNVNNTLLISHVRNMNGAGAIKVNGTVTSDDTTVFNNSPVSLVGATDQILTGPGMLLNLNIAKTGGDVLLPTNFIVAYNGSLTGTGRIRNTGGKLVVGKNDNQFYTLNFAGTVDDVVLDTGDNGDLTFSQNLNINNTLLISHVRNMSGAGAIKVNGTVTSDDTTVFNNSPVSLVGATDQILTGPGMLLNLNIAKMGGDVLLPTNFVIAYNGSLTGTGRIRNTGGKLVVGKNDNQFYTLNFAGTVDDVVLNPGDNGDLTFSQHLNINNTLLISHVRNMSGAGAIKVNGTVTSDDTTVFNNSPVSLVGATDQILTGPGMLLNLNIAKTGGDVLLPTNFIVAYNGALTGTGRIRNTGGKLVVGKNDNQFYTLNFAGTVDDVVLDTGDNGDLTFSQNLNINNTLLISHVRNMNGAGSIRVNGTVTVDDPAVFNNSPVSLVGGVDQTLTGPGTLLNLTVAKSGGDVLLPTDFSLGYNGSLTGTGRIRNTGGKLVIGKNDQQFYTLNFGGTVDDVVLNPGDNGDLTFSQHLNINNTLSLTHVRNLNGPGSIRVGGAVSSDDASVFGAAFVSLVGGADQSLTGAGRLANLDISKAGGDVLMASFDKTFSQVTVSSGSWNVLGNTVVASSGFVAKGGTITGVGTLTGTVTGQNNGVIAPGITTAGVLNTGNLVLNSESVFRARINGTTGAGVDYDQVNVTGSANLGGARLSVAGSINAPSDATQIVLINNDSTDGVGGTFADLPQNGVVTINGVEYRISYTGGTGNDVTLTALGAGTPKLVATLESGNLTVTDTDSTGRINRLSAWIAGTDLVVSDTSERFDSAIPSGATLSDGDRTLTIPLSGVTGALVVDLAGAVDVFTVDWSGGSFPLGIEFRGGSGATDRLEVRNGSFTAVAASYSNGTSGQMTFDPVGTDPARVLTYSGVEKIDLSGNGVDGWTFVLPGSASAAVLEDDGGNGNGVSRLRAANNTFASTDFVNPTNVLAVLRGNAGDTLTVNELPDQKSAMALGSAGEPFASFSFAGAVSLGADRSFEAFAAGTINLSAAASDIATSGSGALRLTTARDIVLTSGSSLTSVNGPLTLEANIQTPATAANFAGVAINGGLLQTIGSGSLTVKAAAGGSGFNYAINIGGGSALNVANGRLDLVGDAQNIGGSIIGSGNSTVSLRPLGLGVAVNLGAADSAGVFGLTDGEFDLVNGGTIEVGSTNSGVLTVSTAITRPFAAALKFYGSAVTVAASGSVDSGGAALDLNAAGGPVTWAQTSTALAGSSVRFSAGDVFRPALTSPTTVRSLNVVGKVDLNGVSLDLDNGAFSPVVGTTYLLIANDGADPVAGEFRDLPEGTSLGAGGGLFVVSYKGGTGNDVVLTSIAPQPEIAVALASGAELTDGQTAAISLGTTPVGTPVIRDFTLRNRGSSTLAIGGITTPAGYSALFVPASVAPGASAMFQIRLNAAAAGVYSNLFVINSNDGDEGSFEFPVYGLVNTEPLLTADHATVTVGEGSIARNTGSFSDPDGGPVTLSASVGTLTPVGVAASLDTNTGPAWRSAATAKPLDGDGDNIYGTDGYAMWGLDGVETVQNPAYATITRNASLSFFAGNAGYIRIDDPANPAGPGKLTGVIYNQPGAGNSTAFFTVTFTQAAHVRMGVLIDNADFAEISPATLRVVQTAGGSFDSGNREAGSTLTRDRSVDYCFFDIVAQAGDSFEVSGTSLAGHPSNGVGGVVFDTLSGASGSGLWTWSFTPDDGPSDSRTVTITATDELGSHVVRTFDLVVTNISPAASLSANIADTGLFSPDVVLTFGPVGDPSAADVTGGFAYSYDFDNDGTWDLGDGTYAGGTGLSSTEVPPQFLGAAGARTLKARVTDKDGGSTDQTVIVTVVAPPIVATLPPSGITTNSAVFAANVDPQSQATLSFFEYGTSPDLSGALVTPGQMTGATIGVLPLTETLLGLAPHTRYYVRAVATNADGTVSGSVLPFDTGNSKPVALNDVFHPSTSLATTLDVLANDTDADGDKLIITSVSLSANATVSVAPGGTGIVYNPADSFVGVDTLTYTVSDGFGGLATAGITIHVVDTMAPIFTACAPAQAVAADAAGQGAIPDVVALAVATDNVAVTQLTQVPSAGTVLSIGVHTVTLTARDAAANTSTCTVSVTINDVTPPEFVANDDVPVALEWSQRYASAGDGDDITANIALDSEGNSYVVGTGPGSSGNQDIAVLKYSFHGALLWTRHFNGQANRADEAASVVVAPDGSPVVIGRSQNLAGDDDLVVARFDAATGDLVWSYAYDGDGHGTDLAVDAAVDSNGDVVVTGGSVGAGTSGFDVVTIKLDGSSGAVLWTRRFDSGLGSDFPAAVALDGAGDVFVTGSSASGNLDMLTFKLATRDGSLVWYAVYNGPAGLADQATALAVDMSGNVTVSGLTANANGRPDYGIVRYRGSSGVQLWANRYNGTGNAVDGALSIVADVAGDVYVTGYSEDLHQVADIASVKLSGDNGSILWRNRYGPVDGGVDVGFSTALDVDGALLVAGSAEDDSGGVDFVVQKIDPATGTNIWVHHQANPGTGDAAPRSIRTDGNGNIFVAGESVIDGVGADFFTYKLVQPGTAGVAPTTALAGAGCQAALPDLTALVTLSDANGPVTVQQSPSPGTLLGPGFWPTTLVATDAAGNRSTNVSVFSVIDTVAPTFDGSTPDLVVCTTNGVDALVTFTLPGASDSCSAVSVTADRVSGTRFPVGVTVVTVSATDASGNRAVTSFRVTVNRAPIVSPYSLTNGRNTNAVLSISRLLGTVTDPDGDPVSVVSVSPLSAQGGTVTLSSTSITYQPPANFVGGDSFTAVLSDGRCADVSDIISVTVTPPPPDLTDATFYTAGTGLEVARYKSYITRDVYQSLDGGVTWTFLGRLYPTGNKTFIIRYAIPATGYYRFL